MKDLIGQRFGRLVVLEKSGYQELPSGKKLQWKCKCDCGNMCYVIGDYLRKGNTKSCGCLKKEKTIERNKINIKDLRGKRFGKLIALYPTEKRASGNYVIWHCKCDCGNEVETASGYLLRGNVQSCGCLLKEKNLEKIKDLSNQKFGKLTALYSTDKRSGTSVIWHCKCECGNECDVASNHLIKNNVQSCGCLTSFNGEEKISKILQENKVKFERQKIFQNCRFEDTQAFAKFDFYLPEYNCLIEYDGIQHYEPRQFGGCSQEQAEINFEKTQTHDEYKNNWCKKNNIKLIRIPYTQLDSLTINNLIPEGVI